VAQEMLQAPCVHSPASQGVAGRMPQHVRMHRETLILGYACLKINGLRALR
jgi:hypothetical protein